MSEDNVRFKVDRLSELKKMQAQLKQEQDELEGYFLARCIDDLADTKLKSVTYSGTVGKVTATMAQSLKLIYPSLLEAALGKVYGDVVTSEVKYKLSAPTIRMLTGLWTGGYTRMTVAEVVEQLPADGKIKDALLKKLKGASYATDKKNLIGIGGYDEKTAGDYAYFIAEAAVWESFARLMRANKTDSSEELQDMIYRSAQNARGAYGETAGAVAKLGILAEDAFGSTGEIVAFSELLNKSFKVGGADMSEQVAGLHQLTQAMASGKLQGDEFRSIGENAPLIAQAIASYMQVPMGELKELSTEGVITADIIKNAMFAASEQIEDQFADIPATFGDRMTETANYALMAFDPVFDRFSDWLNSGEGTAFFISLRGGIDLAVAGTQNLLSIAGQTADFFTNNWAAIEPILWGVGLAVGGLIAMHLIYNGVIAASAAIQGIYPA